MAKNSHDVTIKTTLKRALKAQQVLNMHIKRIENEIRAIEGSMQEIKDTNPYRQLGYRKNRIHELQIERDELIDVARLIGGGEIDKKR